MVPYSIRGERKPSLRTCVLLHLVSYINLTKGRKGRREANWMLLDTGGGWIIRENLRPARHTPVDALWLVSDKQHFAAIEFARFRENKNLSPAFEIARWRKRLRAFSYLRTYRRRLFFLHSPPIDNHGNLIFLQTNRVSTLSVRTCCNFFPNTRCNLQRSHEWNSLLLDILKEISSYLIFANATSTRVHSQYGLNYDLNYGSRIDFFCIFQYTVWNRITLLNAYYSVNALKASITW